MYAFGMSTTEGSTTEGRVRRVPSGLSRRRIVHAAIGLIEREGEGGLSMRRVAAELDVAVMSLYNHVPNKAALLDAVAEEILGGMEMADDPAMDWKERARAIVRAYRKIAHDHPRCVTLVLTRKVEAPSGMRPVEHALALAVDAGFDGETAVRIMRAILAYAIGAQMREVNAVKMLSHLPGHGSVGLGHLDPEQFPHVTAFQHQLLRHDPETDFEFGLDLLLDALDRLPRESRLSVRRPEGRVGPEPRVEHVAGPAGAEKLAAHHRFQVLKEFVPVVVDQHIVIHPGPGQLVGPDAKPAVGLPALTARRDPLAQFLLGVGRDEDADHPAAGRRAHPDESGRVELHRERMRILVLEKDAGRAITRVGIGTGVLEDGTLLVQLKKGAFIHEMVFHTVSFTGPRGPRRVSRHAVHQAGAHHPAQRGPLSGTTWSGNDEEHGPCIKSRHAAAF
jgi:AcrR family transcriptional regulator